MPVKKLPSEASVDHLKRQAKDLVKAVRRCDPSALQRLREFNPGLAASAEHQRAEAPRFTLGDAQFTLAREYGFAGWPRLHNAVCSQQGIELDLPHHERIDDPDFRRAVDLLDEGQTEALREHLQSHPELTQKPLHFEGGNYFQTPTLLAFVAENPVRHDRLPDNIVDIARLILDLGAKNHRESVNETLGLVSSGRVVRECGVQVALIDLLCEYGAKPNGAIGAALGHGEFEAVSALIKNGADVDLLVAAATGRAEVMDQLLTEASEQQRHRALALSCQHGQREAARLLLQAGEDPNRYNPVDYHAHSTPLHQAALAGHIDVVRLLLAHGARDDRPDTLFDGLAVDWARHAGHDEIVDWLKKNQ